MARLLIQGTYAGSFIMECVPALRTELAILPSRDRQPRDMRTALDLIARERLAVRDLVTPIGAPAEAPEVYAALGENTGGMVTAAFAWTP